MEYVCYCTGNAWPLRVWTHDEGATRFFVEVGQPIAEPRQVEPDLWLFEAEPPDDKFKHNPMYQVHLRLDGLCADAWATFDDRETRLSNRTPGEPDAGVGGLVRIASADETLRFALNWFLARGHMGCREPDELCMWDRLVDATAYVVEDVEGWLAADTPLPGLHIGSASLAVFLGVKSTVHFVEQACEKVNARYDPKHLGSGIFFEGDERVRMLVAVGHASE